MSLGTSSVLHTQGSAVTREQKLALIIGFSLILAVGVLISDHLSRARTDTIIADAEIDQPMVVHSITDVPPGIGESGLPLAGRDATPSVDPGVGMPLAVSEPLPGIGQQQSQRQQRGGIDVASLSPRESSRPQPGLSTMLGDSAEEEPPVEVRLTSASSRSLDLPMFEPVEGYGPPTVDNSLNTLTQVREPVRQAEQNVQQASRPQVEAPVKQVTHVVAEGETLYGIAARYYGNGDLWPELLKSNKSAADDEGRVFEGAKLVIPQRAGSVVAQAPAPVVKPQAAKPSVQTQQADASSGYGSYTIKKGDTLSEISQGLMGTVRRMNELIELNKDQIQDADDIRVGMKLRYPRGQRA